MAKLNLQQLLQDLDALQRTVGRADVLRLVEGVRACQGIEALLEACAWVRFEARAGDVEVTCQGKDGRFSIGRGPGLREAVGELDLVRDGKVCNGPCGMWRPLSAYGGDRNRPDGRLQRCKTCERVRARENKKKRRLQRQQARAQTEGVNHQ